MSKIASNLEVEELAAEILEWWFLDNRGKR